MASYEHLNLRILNYQITAEDTFLCSQYTERKPWKFLFKFFFIIYLSYYLKASKLPESYTNMYIYL